MEPTTQDALREREDRIFALELENVMLDGACRALEELLSERRAEKGEKA